MWNRLDILHWLSQFSFIIINETWCENENENQLLQEKLQGYKCFIEFATRSHKHGRPSGGIAVYFKEQFQRCVKRIDSGFKFAVTLELKNFITGADKILSDILLVCVYLPPRGSTAYGDEPDGMVILNDKLLELKSRYPDHKFIVAGDLNSRTGSLQDFVLDGVDHISGLDWYAPDEFNIPRHSVDEVVNVFGRGLIELCTEFNIHILNGRATGDNPGQFTNITESGCSTVY